MFTYAPFMHALFATRPVALRDGALIIMVGVATFAVVEAEKFTLRKLRGISAT